jgi:polyisoprenoid-binding protein YceI
MNCAIATTSGLLAALFLSTAPPAAAADYTIDAAHSSVVFKADHAGFASVYGAFEDVSGKFTVDPQNPSASKFEMTIKVDSIHSGVGKRDDHLKSPDFFNAAQFPTIHFVSKSVSKEGEGLKVEGELTLHGETKPVTLVLTGGKVGEFPAGVVRTGYDSSVTIKRSDFGMGGMDAVIGDEVVILIGLEGTKS